MVGTGMAKDTCAAKNVHVHGEALFNVEQKASDRHASIFGQVDVEFSGQRCWIRVVYLQERR
jgi:hypothetical protein